MDPGARFCGRALSADELHLVRALAGRYAALSRHELAQTICELLDWHRPNGAPKTAECRLLLEELQAHGAIKLPALRAGRPRGSPTEAATDTARTEPLVCGPLKTLQPLLLHPVRQPEHQRLWRSLVERHHYLGHRVAFGAHLRYLVRAPDPDNTVLACLQFSSPAWRMQARDHWIGWNDTTRARNLQHVVCNSRLLILPHVQVKNLASHLLALAMPTLVQDWQHAYAVRPYLVETLVDCARFSAICYRAANWIEVGVTSGRGRDDRLHQRHGAAPKRVLLYPLCKDAKQRLQQIDLPPR